MPNVGPWVAKRRKSLGMLTQQDLSEESDLSLKTISDIESKGALMGRSRGTRRLLSFALRVRVEDLELLDQGKIDEREMDRRTAAQTDVLTSQVAELADDRNLEMRRSVLGPLSVAQVATLARALLDQMVSLASSMPSRHPRPSTPQATTPLVLRRG